MYFNFTLLGFSRVVTSTEMDVLTRFLTVAFFRSRIHWNFIFTSVLMTVHTSSLPVLLVHGETVGSIRTHHALPVSTHSEPDGYSRRHWMSPGFIHKKKKPRGFSIFP